MQRLIKDYPTVMHGDNRNTQVSEQMRLERIKAIVFLFFFLSLVWTPYSPDCYTLWALGMHDIGFLPISDMPIFFK